MAFTSILRKSTSTLATLAGRLVGGQRNYHSALFTAINHTNLSRKPSPRSRLVPSLHYSSAKELSDVDETLIEGIDRDITLLLRADDHDRVSSFLFIFCFMGCLLVEKVREKRKEMKILRVFNFFL